MRRPLVVSRDPRRIVASLAVIGVGNLAWIETASADCGLDAPGCRTWVTALADEPPGPLPPSQSWPPNGAGTVSTTRSERSWYGWQTLIVDATVLGVGTLQIATDKWSGIGYTFAAYALGSPIVHAAHGRWEIAGASLGLHLLTPLVFLGLTVAPGEGNSVGSPGYRATMGALGFIIPPVVDTAFFGWERTDRPAPPASPTILGFSGTVKPGSIGATVVGTF